MKLAVAADHAGYALKESLKDELAEQGHTVIDLGTNDPSLPDDYPDYAAAAGRAVIAKTVERAILICGSGVGVSVAANNLPGIRAAVCHDTYSAHQGVEHDDMNVLVLGARIIGSELARELVQAFLAARYSHEPRHERRLAKVRELEVNPFGTAKATS